MPNDISCLINELKGVIDILQFCNKTPKFCETTIFKTIGVLEEMETVLELSDGVNPFRETPLLGNGLDFSGEKLPPHLSPRTHKTMRNRPSSP